MAKVGSVTRTGTTIRLTARDQEQLRAILDFRNVDIAHDGLPVKMNDLVREWIQATYWRLQLGPAEFRDDLVLRFCRAPEGCGKLRVPGDLYCDVHANLESGDT